MCDGVISHSRSSVGSRKTLTVTKLRCLVMAAPQIPTFTGRRWPRNSAEQEVGVDSRRQFESGTRRNKPETANPRVPICNHAPSGRVVGQRGRRLCKSPALSGTLAPSQRPRSAAKSITQFGAKIQKFAAQRTSPRWRSACGENLASGTPVQGPRAKKRAGGEKFRQKSGGKLFWRARQSGPL